jgi:hypothetical protein
MGTETDMVGRFFNSLAKRTRWRNEVIALVQGGAGGKPPVQEFGEGDLLGRFE